MNIALVGCGRVSEIHMAAYKNIPEARVVAVSDINADRARAFAQKFGIKEICNGYDEILDLKNLDYVDICTPTSTHATIACEAAKSGHNILLEKPMARNTSDCDKIINEVNKNRVKLCLCHNQLFIPELVQVKSMVDAGKLDIKQFRFETSAL